MIVAMVTLSFYLLVLQPVHNEGWTISDVTGRCHGTLRKKCFEWSGVFQTECFSQISGIGSCKNRALLAKSKPFGTMIVWTKTIDFSPGPNQNSPIWRHSDVISARYDVIKWEVSRPENRIFHVYILKDLVELWNFKKKSMSISRLDRIL